MRLLLALFLVVVPAAAEVTLAPIFGNNMVLQHDAKLSIWGRARPRERITIKYAKKAASAKADNGGVWRVEMGPLSIHEGGKMIITGRVDKITLHNVCVGEVWICSGQSNMFWPVIKSNNSQAEIERSNDPLLRLYTVPFKVAAHPQRDTEPAAWAAANKRTVAMFSAVAYFFGRQLRRELDVPVGLIHASVGGTPAEAWTRAEALAEFDVLRPIVKRWETHLHDYSALNQKFRADFAAWKKLADKAKKDCKPPPRNRPHAPIGPKHPRRMAGLWNGMIAPLVPLAMRGVIWYQGESNAGRAEQYRTLFPLMIRDWRAAWGRGDFPFLFVQLANFRLYQRHYRDSAWAELRDAQRFTLSEPATGMAVTIDIGNSQNIHPRNKQEVGRRLALLAKAKAYGQSRRVHSGPAFTEHSSDGAHLVLHFDHVQSGLTTRNGDPIRGFVIAGDDRRFRWAYARVEKNTVVVWHPDIRKPVAARYGWADNPDCNLINGEGLPTGPFRTDDWPGSTADNR